VAKELFESNVHDTVAKPIIDLTFYKSEQFIKEFTIEEEGRYL